MTDTVRFRVSAGIISLALLASAGASRAQESLLPPQAAPPAGSQQNATNPALTPCVQPPPLVRLQDYNGPLKKTVGLFDAKLERKTVHVPHYEPGQKLCSLDLKDKFVLFARDTYDPVTFIAAGFDAGIAQAANWDPSFGQGPAGYGKRFGASFADQTSFLFFKDFAYPSIFSEDPRYYRQIHGSGGSRLWHAVNHAFLAHRDNGDRMFNFSEWLGTTSAVVLSNTYHPGNERGVGPAAELVGLNVGEDIGFDVLREFWPEIAHKFRLPFRAEPTANDSASPPTQ